MSISVNLKDGDGTSLEAKVSRVGPFEEKSLHTNLSGISPNLSVPVFISPIANSVVFDDFLRNAGSNQMAVNGSVTPVAFTIDADPDRDIVLTDLIFVGEDQSLKLTNFFSITGGLTNGLEYSFRVDGNPIDTPLLIQTTADLLSFSSGNQAVYNESGSASALSFRKLEPTLVIRKQGFHETGIDDFIQILVQDNVTGVNSLKLIARGFKVESGIL